jgi:hypothetical protein
MSILPPPTICQCVHGNACTLVCTSFLRQCLMFDNAILTRIQPDHCVATPVPMCPPVPMVPMVPVVSMVPLSLVCELQLLLPALRSHSVEVTIVSSDDSLDSSLLVRSAPWARVLQPNCASRTIEQRIRDVRPERMLCTCVFSDCCALDHNIYSSILAYTMG